MVARALDRRFFVVLIDRKDYFSHQVGLPRAVVEPSMANKSFMPYTRMLTNGVAITATVTSTSRPLSRPPERPVHAHHLRLPDHRAGQQLHSAVAHRTVSAQARR